MPEKILGVQAPSKSCTDRKCPFHGDITVKKDTVQGQVIKKDINHSATIESYRLHHLPKYERHEVRRVRMRVHNPACLDAKIGAKVLAARTRPLSKTKNYVIIQIVSE